MLQLQNTTRSYTGKRGCMCGCNGEYKDTTRARKLAITQLLNNPQVKLSTWNADNDGVAGCIFVETATRNRVLYLTTKGVEQVRTLGVKEEV